MQEEKELNNLLKERYSISEDETWDELTKRVGAHVARGETLLQDEYAARFAEFIYNMEFIPGGRILRNSGRQHAALLNCFVLGVEDNSESIGKLFSDVFVVSSGGGGVGVNFSSIRPKNTPLQRKGGIASGPLSFMDTINSIADTVKTGGQRRAALMGILNCNHPDIEEFITVKQKDNRLNCFNISIGITNKFITAVLKDEKWDLVFSGIVYKTIQAKYLWDLIIKNAYLHGEPGLFNLSITKLYNNTEYYETCDTTNPCGELPLPPHGSCCLGSINLDKHIRGSTQIDWKKLENTIRLAIRFLDNVLTVNEYPLQEIKQRSEISRRIGLGVMGLHYMMIKCGIKYNASETTLKWLEKLFGFIRDTAYDENTKLAAEKGTFKRYSWEGLKKSQFIKNLPIRIRKTIEKQGLRCATCLTAPPTGTTAMIPDVSSGIEPVFALEYNRISNRDAGPVTTTIKDRLYDELGKEFETAHQITPEEHLMIQATIQPYIDSSISKTVNTPSDFSDDDLSKLLLGFITDLKGLTIYRAGSREGEILTSKKDCKTGDCEL